MSYGGQDTDETDVICNTSSLAHQLRSALTLPIEIGERISHLILLNTVHEKRTGRMPS